MCEGSLGDCGALWLSVTMESAESEWQARCGACEPGQCRTSLT